MGPNHGEVTCSNGQPKGASWMNYVYKKFEYMCVEVDESSSSFLQETSKYVEKQVNTVGNHVQKLCTELIEDLLPPTTDEAAKKSDSSEQYQCKFSEPEKKLQKAGEEEMLLKTIDPLKMQMMVESSVETLDLGKSHGRIVEDANLQKSQERVEDLPVKILNDESMQGKAEDPQPEKLQNGIENVTVVNMDSQNPHEKIESPLAFMQFDKLQEGIEHTLPHGEIEDSSLLAMDSGELQMTENDFLAEPKLVDIEKSSVETSDHKERPDEPCLDMVNSEENIEDALRSKGYSTPLKLGINDMEYLFNPTQGETFNLPQHVKDEQSISNSKKHIVDKEEMEVGNDHKRIIVDESMLSYSIEGFSYLSKKKKGDDFRKMVHKDEAEQSAKWLVSEDERNFLRKKSISSEWLDCFEAYPQGKPVSEEIDADWEII